MDQETVEEIKGHFDKMVADLHGHFDREEAQRVHSELTGRLNDHERRLTVLERKPAKGR